MYVRNKRLPFSVVPMKPLCVGPVTAKFTMLINLPENITDFHSFTLLWNKHRYAISVRRGVAWYSAEKIEQYYADNVMIRFTKLMNLLKNTIDFFYLETSVHADQYQMAFESPCETGNYNCESQDYGITSVSTSSISEYLMETLPGWHVDEFLDPSSQYGLYDEGTNEYMLPYIDNNLQGLLGPISSQDVVPQVPPPSHSHLYQTGQLNLGPVIVKSEYENNSKKGGKKWSREGSAVDKSASTKKSKRFW
ncbi:uncharacterized protein LOC141702999 isoform X2 [Apium graveolens]|uniref:uncharacterized protein LOC141702999 isoform X2 n=1 Tax=Apium graveolens TaxID=4045 RepID=UPI003D7A120E